MTVLWAAESESRRSLCGSHRFSVHKVKVSLWVHTASCSVGKRGRGFVPQVDVVRARILPWTVEAKSLWNLSYASTPLYISTSLKNFVYSLKHRLLHNIVTGV